MKINANNPIKSHVVEGTYLVANGFAKMLEKAVEEAEKKEKNTHRKVERRSKANGFDYYV